VIDSDMDIEQERRDKTYMCLEHVSTIMTSYMHKNRCHLKRYHDNKRQFGYIKLRDALNKKFEIHLSDEEGVITYDTTTETVQDGWVLD